MECKRAGAFCSTSLNLFECVWYVAVIGPFQSCPVTVVLKYVLYSAVLWRYSTINARSVSQIKEEEEEEEKTLVKQVGLKCHSLVYWHTLRPLVVVVVVAVYWKERTTQYSTYPAPDNNNNKLFWRETLIWMSMTASRPACCSLTTI